MADRNVRATVAVVAEGLSLGKPNGKRVTQPSEAGCGICHGQVWHSFRRSHSKLWVTSFPLTSPGLILY